MPLMILPPPSPAPGLRTRVLGPGCRRDPGHTACSACVLPPDRALHRRRVSLPSGWYSIRDPKPWLMSVSVAAEAVALNFLGSAQQQAGDDAAAAANLARTLDLYRRLGHQHGQANALRDLGRLQQQAGDYPAAIASHQQALQLMRDLGARPGQARVLNDLGTAQQLAGDYPAAASHQQALELYRDLGSRLGLAEAHNNLGHLATRIADTQLARHHHTQALAIARDIGVPCWKQHAPWKESASPTSQTLYHAKQLNTCGRHS